MEAGVQHDPAPQLIGIPTTDARGVHASASVGRKSEIMIGNDRGGRSVEAATALYAGHPAEDRYSQKNGRL